MKAVRFVTPYDYDFAAELLCDCAKARLVCQKRAILSEPRAMLIVGRAELYAVSTQALPCLRKLWPPTVRVSEGLSLSFPLTAPDDSLAGDEGLIIAIF